MAVPEDKELEKLFKLNGTEAEQSAPSFDRTWQQVIQRKSENTKQPIYIWLSAAASLLIFVGLFFLLKSKFDTTDRYELNMAQWNSPTDILLDKQQPLSYIQIEELPTDILMDLSKLKLTD